MGTYKGFSIKPLARAGVEAAATRTPVRPAPSVPAAAAAICRDERPRIGRPVLDATTSSAARELASVPPLKSAPPVSARPAAQQPQPTAADARNGGAGTLRRIASFVKNQVLEEKRPARVAFHAKYDREELKNLEISEPILQNEVRCNVPSEPLPLEAERRKAAVLRAQSLRAAPRPHGPSNFGSLRYNKRPTGAAAAGSTRPTSQPPPPPPPPPQFPPNGGHQTTPAPAAGGKAAVEETALPPENIYSVIDENPAGEDDGAYKVPRSLDSSLLGEIVSAIQERNRESIYTSGGPDHPPRAYENRDYGPPPQAAGSSVYVCPAQLRRSSTAYDRPDLVKNCDENRSLNRSPDVLDAQKGQRGPRLEKPAVLAPKPSVVHGGPRPYVAPATATVGLKKKLSDRRQAPFRPVVVNKRPEQNVVGAKNPPVPAKPSFAGANGGVVSDNG